MIVNLFLVVFSFACLRVVLNRIALECAYDSQLGQVLPKIMKKENGELRKRLLERTWWQRYVMEDDISVLVWFYIRDGAFEAHAKHTCNLLSARGLRPERKLVFNDSYCHVCFGSVKQVVSALAKLDEAYEVSLNGGGYNAG